MKKISENTQKLIISSYNRGKSLAELAKKFSVSTSTVFRILKKNKIDIKSAKDGRRKILSTKKENLLVREFQNKKLNSSSDARKWVKNFFDINISNQTIRRVLKKHNLCSILKAKKPYLSKMNIKERLKFCKLQRK